MRNSIVILALCGLLIGCSAARRNFELTQIEEARVSRKLLEGITVSVEPFKDSRGLDSGITVDGKVYPIEGNIMTVTTGALEEGIRASGGRLCLFDCPRIVGEVLSLEGSVIKEFPMSRLKGSARIRLRLVDSQNRDQRSSFDYRGNISAEHPLFTDERIIDELGKALTACVEAALKDPALMEALRTL